MADHTYEQEKMHPAGDHDTFRAICVGTYTVIDLFFGLARRTESDRCICHFLSTVYDFVTCRRRCACAAEREIFLSQGSSTGAF